ncbi:MAG: DNA recombination protein RmuC [Bryobacterales bacterium]|nr:DNA recombination protein RmuC [Bryobacterales bacterium]
METQLMYVISIVLGVAFGYFIANMMFRNERNGLVAQGQQAGEAERAKLSDQVKQQELRVAEIEKEREQERTELEQLRDQNEKLKILHSEAGERVAEARRAADEYWQQVVAEVKQAAGGDGIVAVESTRQIEERVNVAAAEARRETEEQWRRSLDAAAAENEQQREDAVAAARREAGEQMETALRAAREEAAAEWRQTVDDARNQAALAVSAPDHAIRVEEIESLRRELEEVRRQAGASVLQAVAEAREEAAAEWGPVVEAARGEAAQRAQLDAAAAMQREEEQWQRAVAEARQQAEEQWQQALAEARRQAEFEREQAAEQGMSAAARIATMNEELKAVRAQVEELQSAQASRREEPVQAALPEPTLATLPETAPAAIPEAMLESFRTVAAEALQANNQKFLDLARVALERIQETAQPQPAGYSSTVNELIKPICETLARVDSNLGQFEKERQDTLANLTEMVSGLIEQGKDLRRETSGLARALHPAASRGRWSEVQLRRVAELAGMIEHCDYDGVVDDAGGRNEMVVHLPNHRDIVVDANVSLSAYLESLETGDEALRASKLREHAGMVRAHLEHLASPVYWSRFSSAPEFVVAFMPSESVFSAALEHDPALVEFGAENRVIPATPTTLIALLKATAYGWRQQQLADNANTVRELGRTLHDRLIAFTAHMEDLRRSLERSVDAYNRGAASLEARVLVSARKFQELAGIESPELPFLDPVESLPRSLQALDSATSNDTAHLAILAAAGASASDAGSPPQKSDPEVPVIELPIVPASAPVIVSEPRVVSEANVVSEPRVVSQPTFVDEVQPVTR